MASTECPTPATGMTVAFGYCAAVRRWSSSGVRRSSRPASTSTGTSGPGCPAALGGRGVGGQDSHSAAGTSAAIAVTGNGS